MWPRAARDRGRAAKPVLNHALSQLVVRAMTNYTVHYHPGFSGRAEPILLLLSE